MIPDAGTAGGQRHGAPHPFNTGAPKFQIPSGAVDCHHHIFDPRFSMLGGKAVAPASVAEYRAVKQRLGITRSVVVAASSYGDDNRCLLDALMQFGPDEARGVAIAPPSVSADELQRLHQKGLRGLRFYLAKENMPAPEALMRIADRAHELGWHLLIVGDRDHEFVPEWTDVLLKLRCNVLIDHLGYAPQPGGAGSATASALQRLVGNGNVYVKLSGVYIQSKAGFPDYEDVDELARLLVTLEPNRILWGTDWPHPGTRGQKPDGAALLGQLIRWVPDEHQRRLILVDNPERLYWAS